MTLLLPFAAGQPALWQVNQVLIRSILVILGVKLETLTWKMLLSDQYLKYYTYNTDNACSLQIPVIGDSPNSAAVEKIVVGKRIF